MTENAEKLLEKASRAIRAARQMAATGDLDFAAGRAYYAMFYAAEALLLERGETFRKHSGVHTAFARQFVNTGELDAKYHRWLLDAFDKRLEGDYGFDATLTEAEVAEIIDHASEFTNHARQLLAHPHD